MITRQVFLTLCAAIGLACASDTDGLPRQQAAAWQAAFDAGSAAHAAGRYEEAELRLREALEIAQAEQPPGVRTGLALNGLAALTNAGELALRQGQVAEAERSFVRAARIAEAQTQPAAAMILQRSLAGRAESMRAQGRDEEAEALSPRIATLCQQNPSPVCASIPR